MAEKVTIEVDAKTSDAEKSLESLNKNLDQVSKAGDKNREGFETLDEVTGGYAGKVKELSGKISGVTKAAGSFIKSLKGVKGALLATGIGAIVVALGTIIFYWKEITEFFEGAEESLQDQADSLRESLGLLDDQLTLLNLQIKILEQQGLSSKELVKEKRKLIILQQEENTLLLEKLKQQLELETAQVREVSFLEKLKIKAAESFGIYSLAAKERGKAVAGTEKERENLLKLEEQIQKAKERSLSLELDLINLDKQETNKKTKAGDDKVKKEKEKADALEKIRQGEIDTEAERRAEEKKKIQDHYKELIRLAELYEEDTSALKEAQTTKEKELQDKFDKEDEARKKAKEEKNKKDLQEEQDRKITQLELNKEFDNLKFEEQRAIINSRKEILLNDELLSDEQKLELKRQFSEATKKIDESEKDFKKEQLAETMQLMGQVQDLVGKQTAAGKALGIATATVNTFVGVSEALKQKSTLPSPFDVVAKVANVATVLASGLGAVKSIQSVNIPGGAGGGGGGSVPATPQPRTPSFNVVGATETSQLAEAIGEQTQEPVQAYVVANDVTTAQSLENNIVEGATL